MKKILIFLTAILIIISILLVRCSEKTPKCSDDTTLSMAKNIIADNWVIIGKMDDEKISRQEIIENIKVEYPRANSFDENIKKYSCKADILIGNSYRLPITYESQLNDENNHIVSVDGISLDDKWSIAEAIIANVHKKRAGIQVANKQSNPTESSDQSFANNLYHVIRQEAVACNDKTITAEIAEVNNKQYEKYDPGFKKWDQGHCMSWVGPGGDAGLKDQVPFTVLRFETVHIAAGDRTVAYCITGPSVSPEEHFYVMQTDIERIK